MAGVRLENVTKRFGDVEVIRDIDLDIGDGEFVVFVGPSGCGKSTLLRLIAGLEDVTAGAIHIGGRDVTRLAPAKRGVAMVFQSYALYPHMDVYGNIAFGLTLSGTAKKAVENRVRRIADMLEIGGLLKRRPRELSGGQRQRVAIARAIVREPQVFLFDEPLSNLDAALRARTRLELARLHEDLSATMIYVTHDQLEAMTLADRIVLLNGGRIEQAGTPAELYHRPATRFAAEFMGSPTMNLLPVTAAEGAIVLSTGERLPAISHGLDSAAVLGIRPEDITIAQTPDGTVAARVVLVEELGDSRIVHAALRDGTPMAVRCGAEASAPRKGEHIGLFPNPGRLHLFGPDGRRVEGIPA